MKISYIKGITLLITSLTISACASTVTEQPKQVAQPIQTNTVSQEELMEKSLLNVGNNYRFLKAVNKAKNGEQVTIAYLGGSITEGTNAQPKETNCYAYLSDRIFADTFAKDKTTIKYINAGISGTPSMLGLERCNKDIIAANPDIVFVEFAVNDDGRIADLHDTYESVVRKLLNSPSQPAVILIFTVGHTGGFWTAQDIQAQIGKQYDLGMISVRDAIQENIISGKMKNDAYFFTDGIHPNNAGHKLIASFTEYYFNKAATKAADTSYTVSDAVVFSKAYENIQNVELDASVITNIGSFQEATTPVWTYNKYWVHDANAGNNPLALSINCSKIIIAYQQKNSTTYGNADVYVDGTKVSTITGFSASAWNNCAATIAYKSDIALNHKVEIKMADGDEKKTITILGIGYVK